MNISPDEIEANRNNPEKLLHIISLLTEAIELDEKKKQKMFQLRWEFTRQLHLKMPAFWLEGLKGITLVKIFRQYCKEYEIVFDKEHHLSKDVQWRASEDWKANERRKYDAAQKKVVTA